MPWWSEGFAPWDSTARWSGGRKWGDGSYWDETHPTQDSGPVYNFEVAVGGAHVEWQSLSFKRGREDWFSTLAATNAQLVLKGYQIPRIGDPVVIGEPNGVHWVGYVESANADQDLSGVWTTQVSAVDTVGRLGQANVTAASIPAGTLVAQVEYLLGLAGIDAEVEEDIGISLPTLDAVTFTGNVLDHIARAEKSSNALLFMRPNGDLRVTQRVALPSYEDRVLSGLYAAVPTSHWPLSEASGTLVDGPGTIDGTAAGSPTYQVEGPWGPSGDPGLGFDGTNDTVSFGDNRDLSPAHWTVMGWAWWQGSKGSDDTLIYKRTTGPNNGFYAYISDSSGRLDFVAQSAGSSIETLPDDAPSCPIEEWFHWAIVHDDGDLYLYLNGSEVARGTLSANVPDTTGTLYLGSFGAFANWFRGRMAQVSLWQTIALAPDEIQTLISGGAVDLAGLDSPTRWSVRLTQETVYNSWHLEKADTTVVLDEDHADSIAAYGLRSFDMDDFLVSTATHFPSGLREAVKEPRLVLAGAPFAIRGHESWRILSLEPLDIVSRDGTNWQVMSREDQITPSEWIVTITGDSTRDALASEILESPTPPAPPEDPDVDTKTVTLTYDATRDSTAYLSSGSAKYGNGTGDKLQVGLYAGGRGRAFIRWPISWPSGFIRVKSAKVKLRTGDQDWVAFGSQPRIIVQRIKEGWSEGSYDAAPPNQFSSNALEWPGPDRTSVGQKAKDVTRSENTWIEIAITDIAQDWHDKGNDGLALISANEDSSSRTTEFYSRESGSEPRLILVCEVEA